MADPLNDGISSVMLLDHMGSDLDVVNAARVSFNVESEWDNDAQVVKMIFENSTQEIPYKLAKVLKKNDAKLIHYLAKHKHWTPFSHPQLKFRIKMPIFIAREWYRHTVGFTRNEVSGRYVKVDKQFHIPTVLREQAVNAKQGSGGEMSNVEMYIMRMHTVTNEALLLYKEMIEAGIAAEQARTVLPQSMYTEFIETASLAAYARLCSLRISPDAQLECRKYAEAVAEIIEPLFPVSWQALTQPVI